ncbi:hypothetical protein HMPREF0290_2821 [Corynebacterium efficiens YS-314]|nr:hypothetical protein HMPREF0290_2821 [Corynebacterium efficiens YS-314]
MMSVSSILPATAAGWSGGPAPRGGRCRIPDPGCCSRVCHPVGVHAVEGGSHRLTVVANS